LLLEGVLRRFTQSGQRTTAGNIDDDEDFVQRNTVAQRQQADREDADLLRRIQRTDQKALASLYDRYAGVLYPFSVRVTGSHEAAEEVVQDVMMHVWEKAATYAPQHGSVYAWLISLGRVKALEKKRAANQKRKQEHEAGGQRSGAEANPSGSETIVSLKGYTEDVRNELKSISKLELRLLELNYYEGQSQSDLARMLRIPLGTIKAKMRRGIQKLRQISAAEAQ
jgi:RNA polymerase sigma-70 factor (ECF subfamily)